MGVPCAGKLGSPAWIGSNVTRDAFCPRCSREYRKRSIFPLHWIYGLYKLLLVPDNTVVVNLVEESSSFRFEIVSIVYNLL